MKFKDELFSIIKEKPLNLKILKAVQDLNLDDCWIGAGFVRNNVWDKLHNIINVDIDYDIDVVFYFPENISVSYEEELEKKLLAKIPNLQWSVKNQARMHLKNGHKNYMNVLDAISYWPETATSIAIRLDELGNLDLIAPYGLTDLFNLIIKPTPKFDTIIVEKRLREKKWLTKWRNLKYIKNHS
jgi:hypothetical protein|nr:nucleotidyltransferase family protein [uncultured Flavobacterium sp.]